MRLRGAVMSGERERLDAITARLARHPCLAWGETSERGDQAERAVEALDTRWILGLKLGHGEKLCLITLWSLAIWLPNYGSDDFRVPPIGRVELAEMLDTTKGTVEGWLRSLRRAGWVRRDPAAQKGALILQRGEAIVPPVPRATGHVYIVSFSDGRIKAGWSGDPRSRVQQHGRDARASGLTVEASWVSQPVQDVDLAEKRLLSRLERNGARRVGQTREYFTGMGFSRAVVLAEATFGASP
jgi:hypothetical protein